MIAADGSPKHTLRRIRRLVLASRSVDEQFGPAMLMKLMLLTWDLTIYSSTEGEVPKLSISGVSDAQARGGPLSVSMPFHVEPFSPCWIHLSD